MDSFAKIQGWRHEESSDPDRFHSVHTVNDSLPLTSLPFFLLLLFFFWNKKSIWTGLVLCEEFLLEHK